MVFVGVAGKVAGQCASRTFGDGNVGNDPVPSYFLRICLKDELWVGVTPFGLAIDGNRIIYGITFSGWTSLFCAQPGS